MNNKQINSKPIRFVYFFTLRKGKLSHLSSKIGIRKTFGNNVKRKSFFIFKITFCLNVCICVICMCVVCVCVCRLCVICVSSVCVCRVCVVCVSSVCVIGVCRLCIVGVLSVCCQGVVVGVSSV
jgi:hypothetical protein